MRTSSTKLGEGLARIRVEIEPAELQIEYEHAVKRISSKARIPGFRQGKAPRRMVESMFGIPAIISEALEHLVPDAYSRAILQEELQPIDQPELDLSEEVEIDKPVIFTATVPLRPTVELGEIESISLTKERPKVQDEEVEEVLLQFQQSRAELKPVEGRPLQEDDMAEMQLSIIAGEIEKTEDNPISVIVGQNWLPKGFDSKVMGMEVRDVRVFELDVPETYHDEDLRGTFATFTAELISMKAPELPDLTDDLIASASDFKTVVELRTDIRETILERKKTNADIELQRAALEMAVSRSRFEIPEVLVDRQAQEMLEKRKNYITSQGIAVDTYLGSIGKTQDQWKDEAQAEALEEIKRTVALIEYASQNNIVVTELEMSEELESIIERYPESERANVRKNYESEEIRPRLEGRIRDRKALETLIETIEVTEEEPKDETADSETPQLEVPGRSHTAVTPVDPDIRSGSV